jgi:hypothetical protein
MIFRLMFDGVSTPLSKLDQLKLALEVEGHV